jgi:signal peptidase II
VEPERGGPRRLRYRPAPRAIAAILVICAALAVDQGTKAAAKRNLAGKPAVSLMGGHLLLRYVENQGGFLSAGARLPAVFRRILLLLVPAALVGAMAWVTARWILKGSRLGVAGPALIIGGGLGNLADRLFHAGRVGDFLFLQVGPFRTGIFNGADLAILTGCVVLLLQEAFRGSSRS